MNEKTNTVELAVALTTAWPGNPNTRCAPDEVHAFLKNSHATLVGLSSVVPEAGQDESETATGFTPAVSVRKSLADPDYLVSMIDGKAYRALKRHLAGHGLTPETYRGRFGLKPDYPMVAPGYSAKRSKLAKELGLGRKGAQARSASAMTTTKPSGTARPVEFDRAGETSASEATVKKPRRSRTKTASPTISV